MDSSAPPPTVDERRDEITARLADAPGVLLALDFDGTLAPIVEDHGDASMTPDCRHAVDELAGAEDVEVAVVSGRAVEDVADRVGIEPVVYAGNHGLELQRTEHTEVHPDAADQAAAIGDVCGTVADLTADVPSVDVENKDVTATVHYRQVPDERVADVLDAVETAVAAVDADLEVLPGKQIREIRPDVEWDKGRVVEQLREDAPDGWLPVYVGDDATDEDALAVVEPEGIGVRVGDELDTAASFRIPDQAGVTDFLQLLADVRDR